LGPSKLLPLVYQSQGLDGYVLVNDWCLWLVGWVLMRPDKIIITAQHWLQAADSERAMYELTL
jgi:hypothetical protein